MLHRHSRGIRKPPRGGQDVGKAPLGLPVHGSPPQGRRAVDEEFFIVSVPVPVPVPVPDVPLGQFSSHMDSTGRQHRFRRLLSVPFSGMGTGTGTGTTEHAGTAEPAGVHGRSRGFMRQ